MREIVTLQFGQQANYVGTHFWNTQESYFTYGDEKESEVDHNVHFRAGLGTHNTETFTPRVLIYDLKGAFGTLRKENGVYHTDGDTNSAVRGQWDRPTEIIREQGIARSDYQVELDSGQETTPLSTSTVRYWSDFNRVYYHPRSLVYIREHQSTSTSMPFERYETGEELFATLNTEHDLLDRDLRPFLEECDQLQGVQMLTGVDDAWGGFAVKYMDSIRDELGKSNVWVWALEDGSRKARSTQNVATSNVARSTLQLASQASIFVPLTNTPEQLPQYARGYDPKSQWHTSALQALGMESMTLFSRQHAQDNTATLDHCANTLNADGRHPIVHMQYELKDPATNGSSSNATTCSPREHMENASNDLTRVASGPIDLSPPAVSVGRARTPPATNRDHASAAVMRGAWHDRLSADHPADDLRRTQGARTYRMQSDLLYPLLDSFPSVFAFPSQPRNLAVHGTMAATPAVAVRLQGLRAACTTTVRGDDGTALCEGLSDMYDVYALNTDENEHDMYDD